jgi:hypothetical protein
MNRLDGWVTLALETSGAAVRKHPTPWLQRETLRRGKQAIGLSDRDATASLVPESKGVPNGT